MNILERLNKPDKDELSAEQVLKSFLKESKTARYAWDIKVKDYPSGQAILKASSAFQIEVIRAALKQLSGEQNWQKKGLLSKLVGQLSRRKLDYGIDDIKFILKAIKSAKYFHDLPAQGLLRGVSKSLQDDTVLEACHSELENIRQTIKRWYESADKRKFLGLLDEIMNDNDSSSISIFEDEWGVQAKASLESLDEKTKAHWLELLASLTGVSASKPSKKWLAKLSAPLAKLGEAEFARLAAEWFGFLNKTSGKAPQWINPDEGFASQGAVLGGNNGDLLKGLAWASSLVSNASLAAGLADGAIQGYRKLSGHGPRASKVANACVYALANTDGMDAVAQLERVRLTVKQASYQKIINKALNDAAERLGMSRADLEEMTVSDFGLEKGKKVFVFADARAELSVESTHVSVAWFGADDKARKSVPASVKRDFKAELKALKKEQKDLEKMLSAQKDRLERLPLAQRAWDFATWQERYLDHPLVSNIARKLIWQFEQAGKISDGFYLDDKLVNASGETLEWLTPDTTVRPWHPVHFDASEVLAWREFLETRELTQPFKQAHREVYLLTDAELNTRIYSNRFAAHILKQHQFNSLCAARGWKNQLRLMVDDSYTPAMLELPNWNLRAEFWIEGIGHDYGTDTNDTGTYLYLSSDQVRFYPLASDPNYAHAGGGGYSTNHWGNRNRNAESEVLALESIPALVFSEVMRDVDLFVGVSSVANDPTWFDGGPEGRHIDYWQSYSFGELSTSAQTRKEALEKLIPRLKIAERCEIMHRFLKVKGDIRNYKIHLGSGNILMTPNDQYLCIVPGRGATSHGKDKVFLPFEGDKVLSIILSKAFMLADDTKITDPTIISQIKVR